MTRGTESGRQAAQRASRRAAMAVLVTADTAELSHALAELGPLPAFEELRRPECGLVMIRGRIGGEGAPFNLGEATVTRAALRLASGEIGYGYTLGRDHEKARFIALCDALMQRDDLRARVQSVVIEPLGVRQAEARRRAARRTAATRVEFFTLQRGVDQ